MLEQGTGFGIADIVSTAARWSSVTISRMLGLEVVVCAVRLLPVTGADVGNNTAADAIAWSKARRHGSSRDFEDLLKACMEHPFNQHLGVPRGARSTFHPHPRLNGVARVATLLLALAGYLEPPAPADAELKG